MLHPFNARTGVGGFAWFVCPIVSARDLEPRYLRSGSGPWSWIVGNEALD